MNNKYPAFVITFISILFISNLACSQEINQNSGLIVKIKSKWEDYIQSLGNIEGKIRYQYKDDGKISYDFSNEFVCLYPLLLDMRGPHDHFDSARVVGKKYSFSLSRPNPSEGWVVKEIEQNTENTSSNKLSFPIYLSENYKDDPVGYDIFNTLGVGLFGMDSSVNLPYIFSTEWVVINEIQESEQGNNKQINISFEFNMPNFPDTVKKLPDFSNNSNKWHKFSLMGKIVLVTEYFLVSEAEYQLKYLSQTKNAKIKLSYDLDKYKIPLPKDYHATIESQDNNGSNRNTIENIQQFYLKETNPKSSKRFTLSAFGLPEPFFGEQRVNRIRYAFMSLGGILIVLALWQMYKKREEVKE